MYVSTERNVPRVPWTYVVYLVVIFVLLTLTVQMFGRVTDVSSRTAAGDAEMQAVFSSFG